MGARPLKGLALAALAATAVFAAGQRPASDTDAIRVDDFRIELHPSTCELRVLDSTGRPALSAPLGLPAPSSFVQGARQNHTAHWLNVTENWVIVITAGDEPCHPILGACGRSQRAVLIRAGQVSLSSRRAKGLVTCRSGNVEPKELRLFSDE